MTEQLFKDIGAFKFGGDPLPVESISTGSLGLDMALGIGGIPRGRITEIYGKESSSKTTLCLHIVANSQARGLSCAYVDMEQALDPAYMEAIGVNLEELWIVQPGYGEKALQAVEGFIKGGIDVIIVDSVAALVPRAELEGETGDVHVGLQARLMSQALRRLSPMLKSNNTTLVFTNQVRSTIGGYGPNYTTSGGNALKFYASVRIETTHVGQIKRGDDSIGSNVRARMFKNKVAPPYTQSEFPVIFGVGVDKIRELVDLALALKIVKRAGSWYSYGELKAQGMEQFLEELKSANVVDALLQEVKDGIH